MSTSCSSKIGWYFSKDSFFRIPDSSSSSVMVPLLDPPLLLERGWEDAEERESPGPAGGLGVGEGDGVSVGDVLLDVEEFPDWGLFFMSIFLLAWMSGRLTSAGGRLDAGPELGFWLGCFSGVFPSIRPAARFLWAAI